MRYRGSQGFSLGLIGYLIITNLVLYVATSVQPGTFITTFGLQPYSFGDRPWTIVTNMFIHSPFPGIGHIAGNMITLYFFGSYLIQIIKERNFLLVYFLGGIVGNVLYLLMPPSPYSIAIGASGAVFAVGGALTLLRPNLRVLIFPIPVPIPLWGAVIGGFLIISFAPYVAWQAHLGGLIFGMAAAYLWRRRQPFFR